MRKRTDKPTQLEGLSVEAERLYETLRQESDRGVAMASAAFLDDALGLMLKRFFIDDAKLADWLLNAEANGPLGSFSVRTKVAYCLGLLGREMYCDLNTIRGIRNDFAHGYRSLSFADQSIEERCRNLKTWLKLQLGPEWRATARDCFVSGSVQLANEILLRGLSLQHAPVGEDFQMVSKKSM